jgi:cyclophilin family peptidyl-prolyl cis-trans isomerase
MRRFASRTAFVSLTALAFGAVLLVACGGDESPEQTEQAPSPESFIADGPHDVAAITVKDLGVIRFELLPEIAPKTVENFKKLAAEHFYDGTHFHRVIPDFMIQGGDPASKDIDPRNDGKGGPGYTIEDEFSDYPHLRGTVSMANTGNPNTSGSQFFIVHGEEVSHLDGKYSAFGRVIEGMEVVDAITQVEIDKYGRFGPRDRPHPTHVVATTIRIEPAL